MVIEAMD